MHDLKGKTALITGASAGLGAHFARVLGEAGAKLILAARRIDALERMADEIRSHCQVEVNILKLDVADSASVATAFEAIADLQVLVNNAGVVRTAA